MIVKIPENFYKFKNSSQIENVGSKNANIYKENRTYGSPRFTKISYWGD
jgi:hypothetical protein